mgnify:CR=1 FL=1
MEYVTDVMVARMLLESVATGESVHRIIKEWRVKGVTIPAADERAIAANFGRRAYLDALLIKLLHFIVDYEKATAKNPDLFRNITRARKMNGERGILLSRINDNEDI